MRRIPWELLALPALGISRALPDTGWGLWVRLAAATACLLLPGALVARALRFGLFSAVLAWSLGALFVVMAIVFAVHASLTLALVLLGVIVAALAVALGRRFLQGQTPPGSDPWIAAGVAVAGLGLGIALWFITTHLTGGDDFFHLARVRKLDDFGGLSLRAVDEFRDGGLHPGYAFPLWHSFLALVARLAGVDPSAGGAARGQPARPRRLPGRLGGGQGGLPLGLGRAGGAARAGFACSPSRQVMGARTRRWRCRRPRAASCSSRS